MYWTDWETPAKIEWASMDGTSRVVLHSTNLRWPNAFTLDCDTQTLYWMDASLDKFESSNADGSNRIDYFQEHRSAMPLVSPSTRTGSTGLTGNWIQSIQLQSAIQHNSQCSEKWSRLDPMGISVVSVEKQPAGLQMKFADTKPWLLS